MSKNPAPVSPFTEKVIELIKKIPKGSVATYGQIAALAGKPGSARAVGWILHSCTATRGLPWQRVLNSQGKISFDKRSSFFAAQKRLLKKDGVAVSDTGSLDLAKYQWKKSVPKSRSKNTPSMFG